MQDPALRRLASAAAVPGIRGDIHDVLKSRATALVSGIRAVEHPSTQHNEAIELIECVRSAGNLSKSKGIPEATAMMTMLNDFGWDFDEHGRYEPRM